MDKGLAELQAGRNALQARHDALAGKAEEARAGFEAEKRLRGERFTVVRAARLPRSPYRPNAPAILLAGLLAGVAAGVSWVAWKEASDTTAHTLEQVAAALPFPALVAIPEIAAAGERRGKKAGPPA